LAIQELNNQLLQVKQDSAKYAITQQRIIDKQNDDLAHLFIEKDIMLKQIAELTNTLNKVIAKLNSV
jgi:hypothetical protein